jgi:hypothetical protein
MESGSYRVKKMFENKKNLWYSSFRACMAVCYILLDGQDIQKQMEKDAAKEGEKKTPFIDRWIKSMLLGRESDG